MLIEFFFLSSLSDGPFLPIIPHLTGMLSLCLYYAPATDESKQITDRSVNLISTHCVALREVQIHNNVNITDESVGAILQSCNQLAVRKRNKRKRENNDLFSFSYHRQNFFFVLSLSFSPHRPRISYTLLLGFEFERCSPADRQTDPQVLSLHCAPETRTRSRDEVLEVRDRETRRRVRESEARERRGDRRQKERQSDEMERGRERRRKNGREVLLTHL
jgi:hypothetical protein